MGVSELGAHRKYLMNNHETRQTRATVGQPSRAHRRLSAFQLFLGGCNHASPQAFRSGVDAPGLAATELIVVLPVFVLILVGMVALARSVYAKIAALTTASDCAMQMAQAPIGSVLHDGDQGQPITQVEQAYGLHYEIQMGTGAGQSIGWCQVAYPFRGPNGEIRMTIQSEVTVPAQPYKSNWDD